MFAVDFDYSSYSLWGNILNITKEFQHSTNLVDIVVVVVVAAENQDKVVDMDCYHLKYRNPIN